MTSPDDDALLAELGEVLRGRAGPPPAVTASAKDLFGLRHLDAELAALTYDSLMDSEPAAVRSLSEVLRTLTFDADGLTIEIEIEATGEGRRLTGQLVPSDAVGLTVTVGDVVTTPELDAFGRFVASVPAVTSRISVRAVRAGGAAVHLVCDV